MSEYNNKDFDPKAAAEARKDEMEEMGKKLENGVKDIFKSENFKKYLDFCAKLPRYSVNNQILIMLQKPEATMCQSYSGWKDMNRFVRKGEKGIRIMAPSPFKMQKEQEKTDQAGKPILDKDGEPVKETVEVTVQAFKPVSTFDVSQTDGEPVPVPGVSELTAAVEGYENLLTAIKDVVPVPISFEQIDSGAKGYFHLEENRIVVQEGMSEAQTVKTLLHEASHQALHSREAMEKNGEKKTQNQRETEAESVAYVVCQHYGIDTSEYSFPYVATWSADKEVPELKASLDTIRRTAADLIVKIDEKMQDLTKVEDIYKSIEAVNEEFPFDKPGAGITDPYTVVEPPVDTHIFLSTDPSQISVPASSEVKMADLKVTDGIEKEGKKPEEKEKGSIKDKIAAGKVEKSKTKQSKKPKQKDLKAAI